MIKYELITVNNETNKQKRNKSKQTKQIVPANRQGCLLHQVLDLLEQADCNFEP